MRNRPLELDMEWARIEQQTRWQCHPLTLMALGISFICAVALTGLWAAS